MEITNPVTAFNTANASNNTAQGGFNEDFDAFLNLLTAQIRNQDPLSPLDSTQFVEQLATFSSLEQQVRGNDHLEAIATMMADYFTLTASNWVGETVAVESAYVPYDGSGVNFTADIPEGTERAILTIHNTNGDLIHSEDLSLDQEHWQWQGPTEGEADDLYIFSIDIYSQGNYNGSLAPKLITEVVQTSVENGQVRLGLKNKLTEFANNVQKM